MVVTQRGRPQPMNFPLSKLEGHARSDCGSRRKRFQVRNERDRNVDDDRNYYNNNGDDDDSGNGRIPNGNGIA